MPGRSRCHLRTGPLEGRAQALTESILTVLTARGLRLSEQRNQQIFSSTDTEQLRCWLQRAATAAAAEDIFT